MSINLLVSLLETCFGTTKQEHKATITLSKLSQVDMAKKDIGWVHMFAARPQLNQWVADVIARGELYVVPASFHNTAADEADEAEAKTAALAEAEADDVDDAPIEDDGHADLEGDSDDSSSDSEDEVPLNTRSANWHFWLKVNKPGKKESAEAYQERLRVMYTRSVDDGTRKRTRTRARSDEDSGPNIQLTQQLPPELGAAARTFYEEQTGTRALTPTCISDHKDCGPVQGRQYLFTWKKMGYGRQGLTKKWVGSDMALKYPVLLENYMKVHPNFL